MTLGGVGAYEYRGDTKGRLSAILNPFSQLFTTEYDRDGKPTVEYAANGTRTEYTYTTRDWLGGIRTFKSDNSLLDQLVYFYTDGVGSYDPTGHLRREIDSGGRVRGFSYNLLYELIQETHPDIGTIDYAYDPNGNRSSVNRNGTVDYYGTGANNRLLWVNRGVIAPPTPGRGTPHPLPARSQRPGHLR